MKFLVLNGPHRGQMHAAPAPGIPVLGLSAAPGPPSGVWSLADLSRPEDVSYTRHVYAQTNIAGHDFWMELVYGVEPSATAVVAALVALAVPEDPPAPRST
ncbi:MAG: hypothetical protein ACYS26_10820 [Planctomycetota bacterium]|jgi:hypothetical protein